MKNQRGQATVEFAFIAALFMFIVLGMIYGGILFMDYLQYNNAARAIARDVAFTKNTDVDELKKYFQPITTLYTPTLKKPETKIVDEKVVEVTVEISLKISKHMGLTDFIGFPPDELKPIVYTMPVEKVAPN